MIRFVVGTGRCGSTLLSKMLAECKPLLSIFEFFTGLDATQRFADEPCDGKTFATMLAKDHPFVTMAIKRGYTMDEITYPYDNPRSRYGRTDPAPWLLTTCLPRMTDDPDALLDEMTAFASRLPHQHLSRHYRDLFDWFTQRQGKEFWFERSGSSVDYMDRLHAFYPQARFLHIHRNGREAALSMRAHPVYRLAVALQYGGGTSMQAPTEELATLDQGNTGKDPIGELIESKPPVEYFGRYWTDQVIRGYRAIRKLNADQYDEVSFEQLVADPRRTLRHVADFLELPTAGDDWIGRAARLIRGIPPTRLETLSKDEQERLDEACRPGMRLLGREG